MRYILTGNKGLIGTFLSKRLREAGHEEVLRVDKQEGFDVNDLPYRPDTEADMFLHFAAQCKINEAVRHPELPHRNNVDGIFNVLEFCRRNHIPKIMVASSSRVLAPEENPYTASKKYAEALTKAYHDCYGLEYMIVRPSTVYGPLKDCTSRLLHDWCRKALWGEELPIFGDKEKTLDFTYVDDFVDGIQLLIDRWDVAKNTDYNISGNQETNLVRLAGLVKDAMGSRSEVVFYPQETAQPQRVNVDTSKIRALGYRPKVNIEEGVRKMATYFKGLRDV